MITALAKARALLGIRLAESLEYRAGIVIIVLSSSLSMVMMLMWMNQARLSPNGQIDGFDSSAFATYFISTWLVSQSLSVWAGEATGLEIRSGQLTQHLLKPLDPMWWHLMEHLSDRLIRLLPVVIFITLMMKLSGAHLARESWAYGMTFLLVVLGFITRFLWEYLLGLLAFWTESSNNILRITWLMYAALGGMFAPVSFYPPLVQTLAHWTPFPYLLSLPASVLSGRADLSQAWHGLVVLCLWASGLSLLKPLVWRLGVRRFGAAGG